MLFLSKVRIRRFQSIEEAEVSVEPKPGVILVLGENHDSPGVSSNGAGKTTFLNAICWALSGVAPGAEIIPQRLGKEYSKEDVEVEVVLSECGQSEVVRVIRRGSGLEVYKGSSLLTAGLRRISDCQKVLAGVLGFSPGYPLHRALMYTSQLKSLLEPGIPPGERMTLFVQEVGLLPVRSAVEEARKRFREGESQKAELGLQLEARKKDLSEALARWGCSSVKELVVRRQVLSSRLEELSSSVRELESTLERCREAATQHWRLEQLESQLEDGRKRYTAQIEALRRQAEVEGDEAELEERRKELTDRVSRMKAELNELSSYRRGERLGVCPKCGEPLLRVGGKLVSQKDHALEEVQGRMSELEAGLREAESELDLVKISLQRLHEAKGIAQTLKRVEEDWIRREAELMEQIHLLEPFRRFDRDEMLGVEAEFKRLSQQRLTIQSELAQLEEAVRWIERLEEDVSARELQLKEACKEVALWDEVSGLMKRFLGYLVGKAVRDVETLANGRLAGWGGVEISISADPDKGSLVLSVEDVDRVSRPLETYSAGEKKRILVAFSLARHEVWRCGGINTLGLLLVDEFFDGLDEEGRVLMLQLLEETGYQVFVVSHQSDLSAMQKVVVVRRRGQVGLEVR